MKPRTLICNLKIRPEKTGEPDPRISKPVQPHDFVELPFLVKPDYSKEIVEKYLSGFSVADVAKLYSCSKQKILSILKQNEIIRRSDQNVSTALMYSQRKGKSGVKPFYGFCCFEGKISKHSVEFPILVNIHNLWLAGKTIHQITQELCRQKIKSRNGKLWSWASASNIIKRFENKAVVIKSNGNFEINSVQQ